MSLVNIACIVASLLLFVFVIDFVRRNLLKEKYAVLWLALSVVILVLSIWSSLLDKLARFVGIAYAPSLLFLVAFIFILLILLHFSVVISILYDKNKSLAQEITLLRGEFDERLSNSISSGRAKGAKTTRASDCATAKGTASRGRTSTKR